MHRKYNEVIFMGKLFSKMFGSKNPSELEPSKSNHEASKVAVPRTKEFTYLPSYHWVQANEFTPATPEEAFAKAKYIINRSKDTVVYEAYKALLIEDGWTITEETPVINFVVSKDSHIANISFSIFEENVLMTILSK
jgi:hypothetical protein